MPLAARLLGWMVGHHRELKGPYHLGGRGLVLNFIGLVFLLFASITFNFPEGNVNYAQPGPVTKIDLQRTQ